MYNVKKEGEVIILANNGKVYKNDSKAIYKNKLIDKAQFKKYIKAFLNN